MIRWIRTISILASLLVLLALPLIAQINSSVRGGLGGVVFDSAGAVMPNITVTITGPQGVTPTRPTVPAATPSTA